MRRFFACAAVSIIALFIAGSAISQESLKIKARGDVVSPGQWSIEDLKRQFAKDIKTVAFSTGKDAPQQTGTGIPLIALIQAAGPKAGGGKHADLSFIVCIEARDGYRVFFSLAELLPEIGNSQAWLLWEMDGKPLSGNEAPCRLIVTTDKGHSRSIFGIASVNLFDGAALANRLSANNPL
jgi:DMSO/TMAO reductase YedYZ molybdopterin-dependent catalytic subunit